MDSFIVLEKEGASLGLYKGKSPALQKFVDKALADGNYTMGVNHISASSASGPSVTSVTTTLADGSFLNTEVREGSISIAAAPAGNDDGLALRLETDSNNGRLRVNTVFDADQQVTLGNLDNLSLNYYIDSSDRTDVIPTLRLIIDADGDLSTTNDRGELVFEWAYQGLGAVTQDSWQTANYTMDDWFAWQRSNGANRDSYPDIVRLSDWADADGYTAAGGLHFDANSLVLGYSIAYGSGNGTGVAYVDEVQVGGVTTDFGLLF